MLCPTEFGSEWQSRSLYYRGGAVITALLAAILHMTLEDSTGFYIFLLLLPSIWSLADGLLRLRQVKVPLLVNAILDFLSAGWLLFNGSITVFGWMWYGSAVLATIAICCFIAVYFFFIMFLRAAVQFLEESRDPRRDEWQSVPNPV